MSVFGVSSLGSSLLIFFVFEMNMVLFKGIRRILQHYNKHYCKFFLKELWGQGGCTKKLTGCGMVDLCPYGSKCVNVNSKFVKCNPRKEELFEHS